MVAGRAALAPDAKRQMIVECRAAGSLIADEAPPVAIARAFLDHYFRKD